jgi:hypothetical protein
MQATMILYSTRRFFPLPCEIRVAIISPHRSPDPPPPKIRDAATFGRRSGYWRVEQIGKRLKKIEGRGWFEREEM